MLAAFTAAWPAGVAAYWPDIVALVKISIWFCTNTPEPDNATPVLPAATATDPAKLDALILASVVALTVRAPMAVTSLWSMSARTRTGVSAVKPEIRFITTATPIEAPTPVVNPTATAAEAARTEALMLDRFCAVTDTAPPTETLLPRNSALDELRTSFVLTAPAPEIATPD